MEKNCNVKVVRRALKHVHLPVLYDWKYICVCVCMYVYIYDRLDIEIER